MRHVLTLQKWIARFGSIAALLVIGTVRLHAQTPEARHTLVVPTFQQYLRVLPPIFALNADAQAYNSSERGVIDTEIALRYPDPLEASVETLVEAYQAVYTAPFLMDHALWNEWILLNWIEENGIDLDAVNDFTTDNLEDPYTVRVEARDFNADGVHEWLLDVQSSTYSQLMVLIGDDNHYQLVRTPLPYFALGFPYTLMGSGFMQELLFEDLNGDGIPEWVLAVGGYGANHMNLGNLLVLQWHDGAFRAGLYIDYASPAGGGMQLFPSGVSVHFEDTDGNGSREIIVRQEQGDNWGCTWTLERVFGWNGAMYSLTRDTRAFDLVSGCEVRAAEEAMWRRDYESAVEHYERAYTLPPVAEWWWLDAFDTEQARYTAARAAIAYTLIGQHEAAESLVDSVPPRNEDALTLAAFIQAVRETLGDPDAMCQAAYNVFDFNCVSGTDSCLGSPFGIIVGATAENIGYYPSHPAYHAPEPEFAGCNPETFIPTTTPTSVPVVITPTLQLEYTQDVDSTLRDSMNAFRDRDFEAVLHIVDQGLMNPHLDENTRGALSYMRAFALEQLDQPEEALRQYVELHESAPETSWAVLAALHFEE